MFRLPVLTIFLLTLGVLLAACGGATAPTAAPAETAASDTAAPTKAAVVAATDTSPPTESATTAPLPTDTATPAAKVAKNDKPLLDDAPIRPFEAYWNTNFSLHTVNYGEILSGGVPRDGIPPIDDPKFVSIAEASAWLADQEPVFALSYNGETKGYPLQILIWHEVANDEIAGEPVAVTFCPLCNSAITFKRTVDGTVYDFGVSGKLRNSDLIMWDRQTESWWQQVTGEAIVGEMVGTQLEMIPTQLVSFADFKAAFPDAQILSQDTGFNRPYGQNPYRGYDTDQRPFLFQDIPDPRLQAVDRVVAVTIGDEAKAYPYKVLAEENVVEDTVGGQDVVVFWKAGTTSALDAGSIADSRDVGAATVFDPNLNGQKLTFAWDGTNFVDDQTGSQWNIFGESTGGEFAGQQLTPVQSVNQFWFAWAAFRPDTKIYGQ